MAGCWPTVFNLCAATPERHTVFERPMIVNCAVSDEATMVGLRGRMQDIA